MSASEKQLFATARIGPWQEADVRAEGDEAAASSKYASVEAHKKIFACGYRDGRTGAEKMSTLFLSYSKMYNDGYELGAEKLREMQRLTNTVPDAGPKLVDDECPNCGAELQADGSCDFCPVLCTECGSQVGDLHDQCPNDECPSNRDDTDQLYRNNPEINPGQVSRIMSDREQSRRSEML